MPDPAPSLASFAPPTEAEDPLEPAPAALQPGLARMYAAQNDRGAQLSQFLAQGVNPGAEAYRQDYLQHQQNAAADRSNHQALALGLSPTTAPAAALPPAAPAPSGPGRRDPSELAFATQPPGESAGAPDKLARVLTAGQPQNVAATETPRVAPDRIRAISDALQESRGAQTQLGEAQAAGEELGARTEAVRGATLKVHETETKQAAEDHDREIARVTNALSEASQDVARSKLDPDRWWKNQGTGDKIRFTVANMLGAFANGFSGGRIANQALEQINAHIAGDLAAQRQEIESKRGRVEDARGLLAETYKRFGNMDQAMAAAHALALQQVDSEQKQYAAMSNSQVRMAESRAASAKIQEDQAKQVASLYSYVPAHQANNLRADYNEYTKRWTNDTSKDKPPLLSLEDYAVARGGAGHEAVNAPAAGGAKTPGSEKLQARLLAYDSALADIDKLRARAKQGGSVSASERGNFESLGAGLKNTLARAQTGGDRAPSDSEQGLLDKQVGENPAHFLLTGDTEGRLNSLYERTIRDREAVAKELGAGPRASGANVGFTPAVR